MRDQYQRLSFARDAWRERAERAQDAWGRAMTAHNALAAKLAHSEKLLKIREQCVHCGEDAWRHEQDDTELSGVAQHPSFHKCYAERDAALARVRELEEAMQPKCTCGAREDDIGQCYTMDCPRGEI